MVVGGREASREHMAWHGTRHGHREMKWETHSRLAPSSALWLFPELPIVRGCRGRGASAGATSCCTLHLPGHLLSCFIYKRDAFLSCLFCCTWFVFGGLKKEFLQIFEPISNYGTLVLCFTIFCTVFFLHIYKKNTHTLNSICTEDHQFPIFNVVQIRRIVF